MKLPQSFYLGHDVVAISKALLGKYLFTSINGEVSGGFIVETEAYNGVVDRASHAFGNRQTKRTEVMFREGGIAYIYLCYGIHEMLNVVTSTEGHAQAILIRAIEPTEGIDSILLRRTMNKVKPNITAGPGSVAKALGIDRRLNGVSLQSSELWIEDRGLTFTDDKIAAVPRIGVAYAGQDALLPYRFYVKGNPFVSKPNK
ncbi:MAG: DNA-3-methyladenine glycosylase [Bacteroidetes bacterium]|nr:DNA-3-methyladenine glycosylase [Bacteroidota bacterium]